MVGGISGDCLGGGAVTENRGSSLPLTPLGALLRVQESHCPVRSLLPPLLVCHGQASGCMKAKLARQSIHGLKLDSRHIEEHAAATSRKMKKLREIFGDKKKVEGVWPRMSS